MHTQMPVLSSASPPLSSEPSFLVEENSKFPLRAHKSRTRGTNTLHQFMMVKARGIQTEMTAMSALGTTWVAEGGFLFPPSTPPCVWNASFTAALALLGDSFMAKENAHLHSMVVFRAVFSGQWTGAEGRGSFTAFSRLGTHASFQTFT